MWMPLALEESPQFFERPRACGAGEHQPIVIVNAGTHRPRELSDRLLERTVLLPGKPGTELDLDEHAPAVTQRNQEIVDGVVALSSDRHSNGTGHRQPD